MKDTFFFDFRTFDAVAYKIDSKMESQLIFNFNFIEVFAERLAWKIKVFFTLIIFVN